jgi:hypothetical protein
MRKTLRTELRTDRRSRFEVQTLPLFRNIMEKEIRNKPHHEKLNTKPNNRQPATIGKARGSVEPIHPQRPPPKTIHDYPHASLRNAWGSPLNFATTQLPQPPQHYSLTQPRDIPSTYTFVSRAKVPQLHYRQHPRLDHKVSSTCSLQSNLSVKNSFQPAARKLVNQLWTWHTFVRTEYTCLTSS